MSYQHNLELEDYQKMAEVLAGIKAQFILSINDVSEMRQAFKDFNVEPVTLKYSASRESWTRGKELLVRNF